MNIVPPRTNKNFIVKRASLASWSENSILSIRNWTTLRLCVPSWNWFFWTWLVSNTKMANSKETFSIGSCWSPTTSVPPLSGNSVCLWLFRGQLLGMWTNRPARLLISQKFAALRGMASSNDTHLCTSRLVHRDDLFRLFDDYPIIQRRINAFQ